MLINAANYGAIGDGVFDNTNAFYAADAAGFALGNIIVVQPGTYLLSGIVNSNPKNQWWFMPGASLTGAGKLNAKTMQYNTSALWPNGMPAQTTQNLVSYLNVPTSSVIPWPAVGIASYITNTPNYNVQSSATPFFGIAAQNQTMLGTLSGINTITQNCSFGTGGGCPAGTGYQASSWIGAEFDINMITLPSGALTGSLEGLKVIGASNTSPTGGSIGMDIMPLGIAATPNIPWDVGLRIGGGLAARTGIRFDAGATSVTGIDLGPTDTTTNNWSQGIVFHGMQSGTLLATSVGMDPSARFHLVLAGNSNPTIGSSFAIDQPLNNAIFIVGQTGNYNDIAFHQNSHLSVEADNNSPPTVSACGTGPSIIGNGGDTAGTVQVGAGTVTSCTVNFGLNWGVTPTVVITSYANISLWISAIGASGFTISGNSSFAGQKVAFMAIGSQ
jgi:hypothetical protein